MADITFVSKQTAVAAEWANEVNNLVHKIFGNPTYSTQVFAINASSGDVQITPDLEVGDPGTEEGGINIDGTTYDCKLRISDIGGTKPAQVSIHRHSTTLQSVLLGSRSNSNTESHAAVTNSMPLFSILGVGHTGTHYDIFGSIDFTADSTGTIGASSSPGRIQFKTASDGTHVLSTALTIDSSQDITIGTTCAFFDVSANQLQIGKGLTTEEANINIGQGRTSNGVSTLDLIGDATYTDYGFRLSRLGTGANAASELDHRGTGNLNLKARDAGQIQLQTNNTTALTVDSSQNVGIGISTPDSNLHVWNGSAGTVSAAANSILTLENNLSANLQFLSPSTTGQNIYFGDENDNDVGAVKYSHTAGTLSLQAETSLSLQVDANATAGNTRLLIYDVDNASLERVSVGAADSGGAGFKVLRIPN